MHSVALDKAYHMTCSDQSSGRSKNCFGQDSILSVRVPVETALPCGGRGDQSDASMR